MIITSIQNPIVKQTASLKDKKYRQLYGEYLVEGLKMVKEAINYGLPIVRILTTIEDLPFSTEGLSVITVNEKVIKYVSDAVTPQGIVAVIALPKNDITRPCGASVYLDGVRDPGNMGTIIRTMAAVGIKNLYLTGCTDAFSPKAIRSSMSGIYFVNVQEITYEEAKNVFSDVQIIVADMDGDDLFQTKVEEDYCIVIGNEANGVSKEVKQMANKVVCIPMCDGVESLNAGVSCAIIMYQLKYGNLRR